MDEDKLTWPLGQIFQWQQQLVEMILVMVIFAQSSLLHLLALKLAVHHQISFVMFEGDSKYVAESLHQPSTSNLDFLMPCFDFFRYLGGLGFLCPKQNILISWLTILNAG